MSNKLPNNIGYIPNEIHYHVNSNGVVEKIYTNKTKLTTKMITNIPRKYKIVSLKVHTYIADEYDNKLRISEILDGQNSLLPEIDIVDKEIINPLLWAYVNGELRLIVENSPRHLELTKMCNDTKIKIKEQCLIPGYLYANKRTCYLFLGNITEDLMAFYTLNAWNFKWNNKLGMDIDIDFLKRECLQIVYTDKMPVLFQDLGKILDIHESGLKEILKKQIEYYNKQIAQCTYWRPEDIVDYKRYWHYDIFMDFVKKTD